MSRRSQPGSLTGLREANTHRVVDVLRLHGSVSQAEIARRTGLSPATVSNIVGDLRRRGVLQASGDRPSGRAVDVSLDPGVGLVAGIDFGNRHCRIAICDLGHNVLAEEYRSLQPGHVLEDGLRESVARIQHLLETCSASRSKLLAAAVGLPGPIDPTSGHLGSPGILPGWAGTDIAAAFTAAIGIPVAVDNDANLGALGEMQWGAGRGCRDFTYLKVTTGIGAGLVLDGKLYRGAAGTAGEIGHTTIDENGPVCRCGNRGCLELFAATPALLELLRQRDDKVLTVRELLVLSNAGDPGCRRVVEDAGRHIGVALANLCNLISPKLIVVGGELSGAGEALLQPMRESLARRAVPAAGELAEIVPGALADRAGVLGAVALALLESGRHTGVPGSAADGDAGRAA